LFDIVALRSNLIARRSGGNDVSASYTM